MITTILYAFTMVLGVILLGALCVMILGGLFASGGVLLGLLAGGLDIAIWVFVFVWLWKSIFKK